MAIRQLTSKWKKTSVLVKNAELRNSVPKTLKMTKESLKTMLEQFKMVYIKPDRGSMGIGVMKVEQTGEGEEVSYRWRFGMSSRTFSDYDALYRAIKQRIGSRSYLVQKGIRMLKYGGLPFDIRVMVQRNPQGRWEVTGLVGRVAQRGKVVTNQHNGGKPFTLDSLFRDLPEDKRKEMRQQLDNLGMDVAKQLQKTYPGFRVLGLDVAVDEEYKPWVLEVNTRPGMIVFRRLKNKAMYYKMIRYARAYGRK